MSNLLPSQRRTLQEKISNSGIPVEAFEIHDWSDGSLFLPHWQTPTTVLQHKGQPLYVFAVTYVPEAHDSELGEYHPGGFAAEYWPGEETGHDSASSLSWPELLAAF